MTSLSTQQKLSMSLDDISDFEKSENKSTFELNVTEPLKNDILELENENLGELFLIYFKKMEILNLQMVF